MAAIPALAGGFARLQRWIWKVLKGWAERRFAGLFRGIPSALLCDLSRIKRGGITYRMPFFIWMTVWSSKRGICFRRESVVLIVFGILEGEN